MTIALHEFHSIRDLVFQSAGLYFKDEKLYFVESRLAARMQAIDCADVGEYIRFVTYDTTKRELDELIDALTTNETYFFRDRQQLDVFAKEVLPQLIKRKQQDGHRWLRIWSAGCSTGEEPYTVAILLREQLPELERWRIQILGTDISSRVLAACRCGIYTPRSLKDTDESIKQKYFVREEQQYRIKDEIKQMVQFSQLNLFNKSRMVFMRGIDCIFCRNVIIYFNDDSARQLMQSFYDSLVPGGYIFLGHAESMHRYSGAFSVVKFTEGFAYERSS